MRKLMVCALVSIVACSIWVGAAAEGWPEWDIVVIAHRGVSPGFPENTLPAFANAIKLGVDAIEVDLRATSDGVIVVLHEDSVEITTNGEGFVSDYTFAELRQLDAGSHAGAEFAGEPIPSLEEVLDLVIPLGCTLLLDIKASNELDPEAVIRLIERHNAVLDVIVGVRSVEDVRLFRSLNPNIRLLGFLPTATDIDKFVTAGVDIVRLLPQWIRVYPPFLAKVHELGKPAWITSEFASRDEFADLIRLGANGFLTEVPEVLLSLLKEAHTE